MDKLSLDEAWRKCHAMWKWIIETILQGSTLSYEQLKRQWLSENDPNASILHNCYFCEYSTDNGIIANCDKCPMELGYYGCERGSWHWMKHPKAFYAKVDELYKIYLENNSK